MGYGDDLMVTGEVKSLQQKYPDSKFIVGDGKQSFWSEIYKNNKAIIDSKQINDYKDIIWIKNYPNHRPYRIYDKKTHTIKYTWNYAYKVKKGEIFFTDQELNFSKNIYSEIRKKISDKKIIYIEPNVKLNKGFLNRDWGFDKWQQVVNELKDDYVFFQASYGNKKNLKNVINLNNVNFRNSCALLAVTDLYCGAHGGLSHAAGALNKKAVVIFGGWINPSITGYDFHKNFYIDDEKSPCGLKDECTHCQKCMELITVFDVKKEIIRLLS